MPDSANAPQISVILPVHNGESRLEACLDALCAQTAESMEIIAIDDGSTDSSPAILDGYPDPRLTVVHQARSGVWGARITGISLARGEWVAFCDADDIPHPDLYSCLLESARANHAQMAVCAYRRMDARTGNLLAVEMTPRSTTLKPAQDPVGFAAINTALWNKMFRMDAVRSCLAVRGVAGQDKPRLMEDMVLIASTAGRVDQVSFVKEPLYDYFVHPGSSMRTLSASDARTVAQWLKLVREDVSDDVRACVDVMAFVHLGVSAVDNLIRTASRPELNDYLRWVRTTLTRDFPRYTTRARSSTPVILRLRIARAMFRLGLLVPAMRFLDLVTRHANREVKW